MATVRKRGDRWQVQVRRQGFSPTSRTFQLRADALTWARQMEAQADRLELPADHRLLKRTMVSDLLSRYRDTVTPRKRSRISEGYALQTLGKHEIAALPLVRLSASEVARYRDDRLKQVKPRTVVWKLSIFRHVLEVARREWGVPLPKNPVDDIEKPRPGSPRTRRIEADEVEAFWASIGGCRNKLIKPFITLALETGMRRGELLGLAWADVDIERRILTVTLAKNGDPRTLPLSGRAVEVLTALKRTNGDGRIFPMSANAVKLAWKRITQRAQVADLHLHDLRHEAISRFFEKGLNIAEVALISGHKDPRMLFRYTHLRAEELAKKL